MATTAIFAELLVIGLQTVLWLAILAAGLTGTNLGAEAKEWKDFSVLITTVVIALAYVLGVLIDRSADSLFDLIDNDRRPDHRAKPVVSEARLTVLAKGNEISKFLEYIRSRLRIARATALNLALGTIAVLIVLVANRASTVAIAAAAIIGIGATVCAAWARRRIAESYYNRLMEAYDLLTSESKPAVAPPRFTA